MVIELAERGSLNHVISSSCPPFLSHSLAFRMKMALDVALGFPLSFCSIHSFLFYLLFLFKKTTKQLNNKLNKPKPNQTKQNKKTKKGMNYLHSLVPPVLHRDLKSLNLLVNESWSVKVADFGGSKFKEEAQVLNPY